MVAECAVVMAIVGHHTTETVLCGAGLTHHTVEYLIGEPGEEERGGERTKREKKIKPFALNVCSPKHKIVFMTERPMAALKYCP